MNRNALSMTISVAFTAACAATAMASRSLERPVRPARPSSRTGQSSHAEHDSAKPDHVRREEPGHEVSPHRATAPTQGRAQCRAHPHRRCRLRVLERLRRPCKTPTLDKAGGGWIAVHAFPHNRHFLADPPRRCSPGATTIPSAWPASPRLRPARRATVRFGPTPWQPWRRRLNSTATPPRSSARTTKSPSGRPAP